MKVISLYDFTGEALRPWAEFGYQCFAFDIQHPSEGRVEMVGLGHIHYVHADLHDQATLDAIKNMVGVVFLMGFPVCTDLAVSGAKHFAAKELAAPGFQTRAAQHARNCAMIGEHLGVPYFVENPVSRLATLWRKPDYSFHPYEYGGYIPEDQQEHPTWPDYIASADAYPKKTCLWTNSLFIMPEKKPVEPQPGFSTQFKKLGGKSQKTKNIRSATPRGFARAVFQFNYPMRS